MIHKFTLQEISDKLNINLKTSFLWRHKILNTLSSVKIPTLNGIVKANETFRGVATKYLDNYSVYCSALKTKTLIFNTLIATHNRTTRNSLKMKVAF
jgi:hypothetical protein